MSDDLITERQGDEIISLLEKILWELKQTKRDIEFAVKTELEEANNTLDRIEGEIGNLKR
jgi:uncharacterized protein YlaN (UPF0358 family)